MLEIRKNFLSIISFSVSLLGLILIYIAATNVQPLEISISEINLELVGRTVTTSGYIKSKTLHENGHLFLTITDGKKNIQVPLFASFINSLNENGIYFDEFQIKRKISVTGSVDEYRNQLQIIPRKIEDIKIR